VTYPEYHKSITIASVYKNDLIRIPHCIISEILDDEDLFVNILRSHKPLFCFVPTCQVFFDDDYNITGFNYARLRSQNYRSDIPTYHVISDQKIYERSTKKHNRQMEFIAKFIDNETNLNKIVRILAITSQIYCDHNSHYFNEAAMIHAIMTNRLDVFKVLPNSGQYMSIPMDHLVNNENIEFIDYICAINLDRTFSAIEMAIRLKNNYIFDHYYDTKYTIKIVISLINLSIRYNNLHAFVKILNDEVIEDLCLCVCQVDEVVTNYFDAIGLSCACNSEFSCAYKIKSNKVKSKLDNCSIS
jgi:hypothetical protein